MMTSQGDLTVFDIGFPWAAASDVLSVWQEWAPDAPDELWANCLLGSTSAGAGGTPSISVNGVYKGSLANANTQLEALAKRLGSTGERAARPVTLLDAMRVEAGCARLSLAECHLPRALPLTSKTL